MKKGKFLWMAVIAALVLVPTLAWAQATISTTGLPATEPSFFVEIYAGGGGGYHGHQLHSKYPDIECRAAN